mmetsp:Transcript_63281/g.137671  ORF Transcript_63281/g.137671 Transcript_63281/m.137671 type:complete len:177 (-) Transcript_63281:4-534(-)
MGLPSWTAAHKGPPLVSAWVRPGRRTETGALPQGLGQASARARRTMVQITVVEEPEVKLGIPTEQGRTVRLRGLVTRHRINMVVRDHMDRPLGARLPGELRRPPTTPLLAPASATPAAVARLAVSVALLPAALTASSLRIVKLWTCALWQRAEQGQCTRHSPGILCSLRVYRPSLV